MESPKKENLVKSPHEITSEMYSSPIQSPIDPRKEYRGQVDDSRISFKQNIWNNYFSSRRFQ